MGAVGDTDYASPGGPGTVHGHAPAPAEAVETSIFYTNETHHDHDNLTLSCCNLCVLTRPAGGDGGADTRTNLQTGDKIRFCLADGRVVAPVPAHVESRQNR